MMDDLELSGWDGDQADASPATFSVEGQSRWVRFEIENVAGDRCSLISFRPDAARLRDWLTAWLGDG
jgi:hypothetical protein